jgi:hypothetical protein
MPISYPVLKIVQNFRCEGTVSFEHQKFSSCCNATYHVTPIICPARESPPPARAFCRVLVNEPFIPDYLEQSAWRVGSHIGTHQGKVRRGPCVPI